MTVETLTLASVPLPASSHEAASPSITPTTVLFMRVFSQGVPQTTLEDPGSLEESTTLPGASNVLLGFGEVATTLHTLVEAEAIGDTATQKSAYLHLCSEIASIYHGAISGLGTIFSTFQVLPPETLAIFNAPASIFGALICSIESFVESYRLASQISFLKNPFFLAKKFLSVAQLIDPSQQKLALEEYIQAIKANRTEFEQILGKEKVDGLLAILIQFQTYRNTPETSGGGIQYPRFICPDDEQFIAAKAAVLQFHLAYFYQKYFAHAQKIEKSLQVLNEQIKLLENNPEENKQAVLDNLKKEKVTFDPLISGKDLLKNLTKWRDQIENPLSIAQNYLRRHLSSPMVAQLRQDLNLFEALESEDMKIEGKATKAEVLFNLIEQQATKKAIYHTIMLTALLISLVGFVLLLVPGGFFFLPMALIGIGFIIGLGGYVFEQSVLPEIGWRCNIKKSIPLKIRNIAAKVRKFWQSPVKIGVGPETGYRFLRA